VLGGPARWDRNVRMTDDSVPGEPDAGIDARDVHEVTSALLTASRLLVAISARSLAAVDDVVTPPQFRLLVVMSTLGPAKLVTLAELLAVNPSTALRMVDRLASAGLVTRRANPRSRREVRIELTASGRAVVDEVTARRRADIAAVVARMPPERRHVLVAALRAFTEAGGEPPAADVLPLGWT
jgi:DNA-binding MarR family transcriptional regulator